MPQNNVKDLNTFAEKIPTTLEGLEENQAPLIFDIETNGLLDTLTKVHCIVLKNPVSGKVLSAHHETIPLALDALAQARVIVGHNIIPFDSPALQKVYPGWKPEGQFFDTLNASRLIWPELIKNDFAALRKRIIQLPKKLIGSHSLKAWGYRLGDYKGDFGETSDWAEWSPEMQSYCEQDVTVTERLFLHILAQNYNPFALALEMAFQECIAIQERFGFPFNLQAAEQLYAEIVGRRAELEIELATAFPPQEEQEIFIPKVNNKTRGYVKGQPFIKTKIIEFNPRSTAHIAARLHEKYNWKPTKFTETKEPQINGEVLGSLPYPEAKPLAEHRDIQKVIGMLAEGPNSWLKLVTPQSRIHGRVTTNGAVTGRCTHSKPNLGQVPKQGELGRRCRELFVPPKSWTMFGADASGLELRVFGHFLARYDGGKYALEVVNGDIHSTNQKAAGLPTRDHAKTFIYAFLYGAGPGKLGSIVDPYGSAAAQRRQGLALKNRFLRRTPAIKKLVEAVASKVEIKGYLRGIDGRRLSIRSSHSALNALFQSAGAVLVKLATVVWHWKMAERGYVFGKDYAQLAHIHDEVQGAARTSEIAEEAGKLFVQAIEESAQHFGFRVPMTGEYKLGNNWAETH